MALPDDFDLSAFLWTLDKHPELRGTRVVYFDGAKMHELREGPAYCDVGLTAIVIRAAAETPVLHVASAAKARDGKLLFELLGVGLSCSAAVLGWVVVAGSAGAAPITGGSSVLLTYLSFGAASASSVQCANAVFRTVAEGYAPHDLDVLDTEGWYQKTSMVLDVISLAGAVASTAMTIRMALRLEATTGQSMRQVLKGLSRQQRKALAEEAIRLQNPGISGGSLKVLVRAGVYPQRFTSFQISQTIRNQLRDALGAAISFTGSATGGLVQQYVVGMAQSVETYQ